MKTFIIAFVVGAVAVIGGANALVSSLTKTVAEMNAHGASVTAALR